MQLLRRFTAGFQQLRSCLWHTSLAYARWCAGGQQRNHPWGKPPAWAAASLFWSVGSACPTASTAPSTLCNLTPDWEGVSDSLLWKGQQQPPTPHNRAREPKFSFRLKYSLLPSAALAEGNFYQKYQIPAQFKGQGPCLRSSLQLERLRKQHLRQTLHKMYFFTEVIIYMHVYNFKHWCNWSSTEFLSAVKYSLILRLSSDMSFQWVKKKSIRLRLLCQTSVCLSFTWKRFLKFLLKICIHTATPWKGKKSSNHKCSGNLSQRSFPSSTSCSK